MSSSTEPSSAQSSAPVTGNHVVLGAGPVGRAVVHRLVGSGVRPVVVTRSGASVDGAGSFAADLTDRGAARQALAGASVVYQCSQPAYNRWPQQFPNLQRSIIDAAAAAGAVVVTVENMYGYGPVRGPMSEATPLAATTRKGAVRAALWNELEAAHRAGTVRAVAVRASDFYGPGVTESMLGDRFFPNLLAGRRVDVVGDPAMLHTVTYVPDLARAMVRLGDDPPAWGRAWHVPNAPTVTTSKLVAIAGRAAGTVGEIRRVARWQLRLLALFVPPVREMLEMLYEFEQDFVVDSSAYVERYGDDATPLDAGMADTVAWYRTHHPRN